MKSSGILFLSICTAISVTSGYAATTSGFEGLPTETPVTLQTFGEPGGPSIQSSGGNPGGFLRLTDAINGQNNYATFDRSDAGAFALAAFGFQFRIAAPNTPSADGFSFSFANTANYGTSGGLGGPALPAGEDPAGAGVLGFGFDTWSNQGAFDNPAVPQGSDYQEISLFWNGALIRRIDDTRPLGLTLDDGNWHTVAGSVDFAGATASLTVDGIVIFNGEAVAGLTPFESRIMLAARTGGENEIAGIDNLNVLFVPEPSVSLLGGLLGLGGLLFWRAKRR